MTWVGGPLSTFGLPTFEKRDHRRVVRHSKIRPLMSAMGQKQTSRPEISMSALPPKADIAEHRRMSAKCHYRTPSVNSGLLVAHSEGGKHRSQGGDNRKCDD
jgi:hypothetical protein